MRSVKKAEADLELAKSVFESAGTMLNQTRSQADAAVKAALQSMANAEIGLATATAVLEALKEEPDDG